MTRVKISDLRQEIKELRSAGCQMANLCFNLSQMPDNRNAKVMRDLYKQWDAIKRRSPNVTK